MDYDFARLDLHDESEAAVARREGWLRAVRQNFRQGRPDADLMATWLARARQDGLNVTGAWLPEGEYGAGPVPVATYASFDKPINLGRAEVPARLVTEVTTSPTHLRRGLLRRLIEDDLADAVSHGLPLAALTAAEATIYGRWGFGVATLGRRVEVTAGPRFALRDFDDPGRCELVDPRTAWATIMAVYEPFHARTRGSVGWPANYEDMHTGVHDHDSGEDTKLQGAVHLDATGTVDGFVLFHYAGSETSTDIKVHEMVALTPEAQLSMWQLLAGIDRIGKISHAIFDPLDPLPWALTDINVVRLTGESEFLWLRVLDVPACLQAREWSADGEVVIEVDDPLGHAAGRFTVRVLDGQAAVRLTDAEPDVRLSAETLATVLLGPTTIPMLHSAGRLGGSSEAVATLAAMADLAHPPYSITGF